MTISTPLRFRWPHAAALIAVVVVAVSAVSAAPTAETPAPPETSAPPPPPPSPPPAPTVSNSSSGYDPVYSPPATYRDPMMDRTSDRMERDYTPPSRPWQLTIFFPPTPPTLGSPIPFANPLLLTSERAPTALAEYVNEFFYAPLSTRVAENRLSARQQEKVKAYRAAKLALQKELRDRLAELRLSPPAVRTEELAILARAQAPRLAALEKMAEELRAELVKGEFFQSSVDWNVIRDWKLDASRFATVDDALNAQYQVMRAAPFYLRGLLPEQRGMLREIAIEFREVSTRRRSNGEDSVNPPLFFSPATSRLRLPAGLPTGLADKIAAYEKEKAALKEELRLLVYTQDKTYLSSNRVRALEALAEKQWPRIAALEEAAEEIRRDLARLPEPPGPPAPPPLPAALAARISIYLEERTAIQQDILAKIGQIKKEFAVQRVVPGKNSGAGGDLRLVINPGSQTEERMNSLKATLATFNQEMSARQRALRAEEDAIRREFMRAVPDTPGNSQSLETLLNEYAEALLQREDWARYEEYQTAMLTPGLSPEQRRLLYDGAVEKLALPLPGWDVTMIRIVR